MRCGKKTQKHIAALLLAVLISELIYPNTALALTSGPSQPEVQSFEPVGTTDMVDMFTGDFVYNIPLLDVEGYPVNIAYHGGITMEQEASWVGLGWNINPGVINRTVRGIPDDFNGDSIKKQLHIKDESTFRVGLGLGIEKVGRGDPDKTDKPPKKKKEVSLSGANAGVNLTFNNYRGVSCDLNLGGNFRMGRWASAGVNIGVGSQSGAEIDYNANLHMSVPLKISETFAGTGVGVGVGGGYNSRQGMRELSFTSSATLAVSHYGKSGWQNTTSSTIYSNTALQAIAQNFTNIPIGLQNYVPVITNSSTLSSWFGRIKVGKEYEWCFGYGTVNGMYSVLHYNEDGSRPAYGYLNIHNAGKNAIVDFTRDKDGMFNKTMQYLPLASMAYDVYSVSGHGTGGVFRPFRNDFASVYDPLTESEQKSKSGAFEAGFGKIFEAGADLNKTNTKMVSGPWADYFRPKIDTMPGKFFERTYFKQGGELNAVNAAYMSSIGSPESPLTPDQGMGLPDAVHGSLTTRAPRANLIYTNADNGGRMTQVVQTQKDGRRFVYGQAAMNNIQKEATFSVSPPVSGDLAAGVVGYTVGTDDAVTNGRGIDNLYSGTVTPAYAHSFLLTAVLSSDYVDVTGNGISDDDLGSYTKFNYTLKESDYRWKAPYEKGKAQYSPGFWSEQRDDKGNYIMGSRQQWILSSIETKNQLAEFFTSARHDGLGSKEKIDGAAPAPYSDTLSTAGRSYKLDSIILFNKHDRIINAANAVPIKTIFFNYDYSLCPGIPNTSDSAGGKLTLRKIYFRYGHSQKSMLSPYRFDYRDNPSYNLSNKDRWGNYKPNSASFTNYEFPYVDQNHPSDVNSYAAAWSLTRIQLPSGGVIESSYESDDYAYVQDKQVSEMFMVSGVGSSPVFSSGTTLYKDKNTPYLYLYFNRRISSESSSLSFADNYFSSKNTLNGTKCLYYNFHVQLADKKTSFEQIKGYAEVESIGPCSDGTHGYIKLKAVVPKGTAADLNPITFTALNTGRYNLPQIIFPGADPDMSDLMNILTGLKGAFGELVSILQNPLIRLVKKGQGKNIRSNKCFVRLDCVGLRKKGGGQRVKQLTFSDKWQQLAGGNSQDATYGKVYDYTINEGQRTISSGVASYEPLIGGDENPFRMPVPYSATKGGKFPPNDPVDLYQELPIGESLYPPAVVGYRKVTVKSIHADVGNSSQGVDVYQYYTAKEFPIRSNATGANAEQKRKYGIFSQENTFEGKQGYALVFNDMHGKLKSIDHSVFNRTSHTYKGVSSQQYNYRVSGGQLDNNVNCLVYQGGGAGMVVRNMMVGVEADITIDTREKKEETVSRTINSNLNVSNIASLVIPIPFGFTWETNSLNQFHSVTVTKVTQQYGILDNVYTNNEGAITTMKNELFDPESGNVVVTSVNNEYQDKEYTVDIPAWWAYLGMGTAYNNYNYEFDADTVEVDTNYIGKFIVNGRGNLFVGDEIEMTYITNSHNYQEKVWYLFSQPVPGDCTPPATLNLAIPPGYGPVSTCCRAYIIPRYPRNTINWYPGSVLTNVHFKISRPGPRNMLDQSLVKYTMLDNPIDGTNRLKTALNSLVNISAVTFSDSNTRITHRHIVNPDTISPFAIGERGVFRQLDGYSFVSDRHYAGTTSRNAGVFNANNLFIYNYFDYYQCFQFPYRYLGFDEMHSTEWKRTRTVTKWSPNGKEVENRDATGNYSTALYGYNEALPIAVASNAKQGEVLAEGFEDRNLLQPVGQLVKNIYSPFSAYFGSDPFDAKYELLHLSNPSTLNVSRAAAHSGMNSLYTTATSGGYADAFLVNVPLNDNTGYATNRYNLLFPYGSYSMNASNEYLPFILTKDKKYVLSYWLRAVSPAANTTNYTLSANWGMKIGSTLYPVQRRSDIIDGWQQVEVVFTVTSSTTSAAITLPKDFYVDDLRIFPSDANMKAFVYNPVNEKLMATMDENNFATFYEYDNEGNLTRVKKETAKGIMTVSESRNSNPKL